MVAGIDISLKETIAIAFTIAVFAVLSLVYIKIIFASGSVYTSLVGENLAHAIDMVYAAPPDRDTILLFTQTKGGFVVDFTDDPKNGKFVIEPRYVDKSKHVTYTAHIFKNINIIIDDSLKISKDENITVCPPETLAYQTIFTNKKGKCALDFGKPCYIIENGEGICKQAQSLSNNAFELPYFVCIAKKRSDPNSISIYKPGDDGKC